MKLLRRFIVLATISVAFSFPAHAQLTLAELHSSMVGSWLARVEGESRTRTLIITAIAQSGTGGLIAVGTYGFSDDKRYPIKAAEVLQSGKDVQLKFLTAADSLVIVNSNPDGTLVGTIKYVNAQPKGTKFEKSVAATESASTTGPAQSGSATGAASGSQGTPANSDAARRAILEVAVWHVKRSGGTSTGQFEMRGDKLWAKFDNNDGRGVREVQVNAASDGLNWYGASGRLITLRYDPKNAQTPFKGTDTGGAWYEFSPR